MRMQQSTAVSSRFVPFSEKAAKAADNDVKLKYCSACEQWKPLTDFSKNRTCKSGYDFTCKGCHQQWIRDNHARMLKYRRHSRRKHAAKIKSRSACYRAILRGDLVPGPCAICGTTEHIEAHHEDYTKPLEVVWLCNPHHNEVDHGYLKLEKKTTRKAS